MITSRRLSDTAPQDDYFFALFSNAFFDESPSFLTTGRVPNFQEFSAFLSLFVSLIYRV